MKKTNGFTLVELLAVIILLGLIAAIGLPAVKSITNGAKQKGYEKQIATILESAKNWGVKNASLLPEVGGSILVKIDTLKKEGFLENKSIMNPVEKSEMNGCAEITYNATSKQYEYEYKENCVAFSVLSRVATTSTTLNVNSIPECATSGICATGTEFAIQVNSSDTYKFYVLNDDGKNVTLIMAEDLGDPVAWDDSEQCGFFYEEQTEVECWPTSAYGPLEALKKLKARTSNWTNITEYSYELNYGTVSHIPNIGEDIEPFEGKYSGEYVQNVRARMPKNSDIDSFWEDGYYYEYDEDGNEYEYEVTFLPSWLLENIDGSSTYWLSDAGPYENFGYVYVVQHHGASNDFNDTWVYPLSGENGDGHALRPVITVLKIQAVY